MFAEIMIDEPLEKVIEDRDFVEEKILKKFLGWLPVGQNIYGIRRRHIEARGINDPSKGGVSGLLEIGPKGLTDLPFDQMHFHVSTGGTPHHVPHNFGFWHINDMDELFLPIPSIDENELGYFVAIMQRPLGKEGESFAWYCEECWTILYEWRLKSGELGFDKFWKGERAAVNEYNRDVALRTCNECGHVNPLGYCWHPSKDTPEEKEARAAW